ncbi:hypothetical protein SDC9_09013 [bioreactor metagenome]|uniref:Uncharacterized protein n=1 Tax=bioreactor metagenome TaxID=1076179 RepID=A0A644T8W3_9ZZZZ|nr:hypothetical protein [Negativicutes bacterium]
MCRKIWGYFWTIYHYQKTEKGRHDIIDYLQAIGIMILVMLLLWTIMIYLK